MSGPLIIEAEPINVLVGVYRFIEFEFRFTIASPDTT